MLLVMIKPSQLSPVAFAGIEGKRLLYRDSYKSEV